jgi:hypothetical protein
VDAAGDAATAALTAVSAAADEAQARLAAKARMRELEHAVVTARAGGLVEIEPPTRAEALKLANRVDPGSSGASSVRGLAFILAGIVALALVMVGGFGWLGVVAPVAILITGGSLGDRVQRADRSRKAGRIQLELARASLASTERARGIAKATAGPITERPRLIEDGDPRSRAEVLAVLDRLVANVRGLGAGDRRGHRAAHPRQRRPRPADHRRATRPDRPRDVAAAPDLHRLRAWRFRALHRAARLTWHRSRCSTAEAPDRCWTSSSR